MGGALALTGVPRRLRLYASMVRYANAHNRDFAVEHVAFFQQMLERLRARGSDPRDRRVLDVGCGKSFWLSLLLHSYGARVTGVDTEDIYPRATPAKYLAIARKNGLERAARTLMWDAVYARPYYAELARRASFPLQRQGLDLRRMDITRPEFAAGEFDLVVSHEVFEHVPDVAAAARNLRRMLKPDGLTYIYVHSFTSLSGGHHIAWKYPDTEPSASVPPWDHLRARRFPDIPSWVNGLREHQYREAFEPEFEILDWLPTHREGAALLTPALRAELAQYSEHELLTKGFIIVGRPRPGAA